MYQRVNFKINRNPPEIQIATVQLSINLGIGTGHWDSEGDLQGPTSRPIACIVPPVVCDHNGNDEHVHLDAKPKCLPTERFRSKTHLGCSSHGGFVRLRDNNTSIYTKKRSARRGDKKNPLLWKRRIHNFGPVFLFDVGYCLRPIYRRSLAMTCPD